MAAPKGMRALGIDLEIKEYNYLAKRCIDARITKREAIKRFIRMLRKQPAGTKGLLDEYAESDFGLDA